MIVRADLPLLVALGCCVGGCTLFVETEDLRSGAAATTGAGGATTSGAGATSTGSTTGSAAGGGGGGPASTSTAGGGGPVGAGPAGGGGAGGDGGAGGAGPTWCVANAPPDAYLCADFDTPSTGLTSPPWSNSAFEDESGSSTLDTTDPSSPPGSARVEVVAAEIPDCGFQALRKSLPGSPDRLLVRFDVRGEVVDEDSLIATVDWRTAGDVDCKIILGLGSTYGFLYEQQFDTGGEEDGFDLAASPLDGWHTIEMIVDTGAGFVEVAIDGSPMQFVGAAGAAMPLSVECDAVPQPGSAYVRLGPHCETPPFVVHYDDVILAPG